MPSITVWKCASRQRDTPRPPAAARAPPDAAACRRTRRRSRVRHHASFVRASVRVGDLVDDVVDFAAERVERGDRAPPLRRQEQEAVVEARAALRGPSAGSIRRASCGAFGVREAMAARRKQRVARDAGPVGARELRAVAEDVAAGGVDAVEDAVAAGEDAATARAASRHGSARVERASRLEQRAGARGLEGDAARASASSQRASAICASVTPKRARSSCGR